MIESDTIGKPPDFTDPHVLQGPEGQARDPASSSTTPRCLSAQSLHLVGIEDLPEALVNLLQEKFATVMRDPQMQESIKEKWISRRRIGRIVDISLRGNRLSREDVRIILIHNVMLACRKSGCQITIGINKQVKDLTKLLEKNRASLRDWFMGITEHADHHCAGDDASTIDDAHDHGFGLGAFGCLFDATEYGECLKRGIDPRKPTAARPGSEQKVLMLSARYSAGLPLWHDRDGPPKDDLPGVAYHQRPLSLFTLPATDDDEDDPDDSVVNVDVMQEKSILPT